MRTTTTATTPRRHAHSRQFYRKALEKAKGTGLLDFSHPIVVRAMGAIDVETAKREGLARDHARNDANSVLAARAAERRRQVHEQLLPDGPRAR
jgi:hypothetical protein